jgi:2-iminobutanoate/2-iminopropanoate deaminase
MSTLIGKTMNIKKQVFGEPLLIDGRQMSLSKAVRAGDFVFLTGQIPMRDGSPMTDGTIEDQTRACIETIRDTLQEAGCELGDVVKSMVWLKNRADFPRFNEVYAEYFTDAPPARSAIVSDFLLDILVEIECVAYKPLDDEYSY